MYVGKPQRSSIESHVLDPPRWGVKAKLVYCLPIALVSFKKATKLKRCLLVSSFDLSICFKNRKINQAKAPYKISVIQCMLQSKLIDRKLLFGMLFYNTDT